MMVEVFEEMGKEELLDPVDGGDGVAMVEGVTELEEGEVLPKETLV